MVTKLAVGKCASCGEPWSTHKGVAVMCKQKEKLRGALRGILHWTTVRGGLTQEQLSALCEKVLEETE